MDVVPNPSARTLVEAFGLTDEDVARLLDVLIPLFDETETLAELVARLWDTDLPLNAKVFAVLLVGSMFGVSAVAQRLGVAPQADEPATLSI